MTVANGIGHMGCFALITSITQFEIMLTRGGAHSMYLSDWIKGT